MFICFLKTTNVNQSLNINHVKYGWEFIFKTGYVMKTLDFAVFLILIVRILKSNTQSEVLLALMLFLVRLFWFFLLFFLIFIFVYLFILLLVVLAHISWLWVAVLLPWWILWKFQPSCKLLEIHLSILPLSTLPVISKNVAHRLSNIVNELEEKIFLLGTISLVCWKRFLCATSSSFNRF